MTAERANRRIFVGHAVNAVMSFWLGGFQHEDPETRGDAS